MNTSRGAAAVNGSRTRQWQQAHCCNVLSSYRCARAAHALGCCVMTGPHKKQAQRVPASGSSRQIASCGWLCGAPSRSPVATRAVIEAATEEALLVHQPPEHTQALAAPPPTLLYRFIVPEYVTRFGENLKVVGSAAELGGWNLNEAPTMTWHEGHRWVFEARLPKSTFEFKVVALLGQEVRWEQGVNRIVQAEEKVIDVPVELVINLTCSFGFTDNTGVELVLDRNSVQESYELAAATLELLRKRRTRLEKTLQEEEAAGGGGAAETMRAEVARLEAAVSSQAQSVEDLGELVFGARLSEDGRSLLLKLDDGKVHMPKQITSLSQAHSTSSISLAPAFDTAPGAAALLVPCATDEATPGGRASPSPLSSSDSDTDIEPDDAAAAMAAAAFASLNFKRPTSARRTRSKAVKRQADHAAAQAAAVAATSAPAPAQEMPSPAAAVAAAQAPAPTAAPPAAAKEWQVSATSLFFGVDLSSLPPPQEQADGALYFSAELLASLELPKARSGSSSGGGGTNGAAPCAGEPSSADIARRLASLSASLERTLEHVARRSDTQQPAGAWREVDAQLQEAQALQEQLMTSWGGLNATQQEELQQLQELVRMATSTVSNRQRVTMTISRVGANSQEVSRLPSSTHEVERAVAATV